MKHIEEEECSTSLLEMAYIMARLILIAMLICLNSASPFLTEYRKTRDYNGEHSQGMKEFLFFYRIEYIDMNLVCKLKVCRGMGYKCLISACKNFYIAFVLKSTLVGNG